jgi:voltage-gated potassium channel Kch
MRGVSRRLAGFLAEDRGLSLMLFILATVAFVAAPLAKVVQVGPIVLSVAVSLMFACGAFAVSRRRWEGITTTMLAALAIGLEWGGRLTGSPAIQAASALAGGAFAVMLTVLVLAQVFKEGPITVHRIVGSIAAYLLLAFAFGEAALFLSTLEPQAYQSALYPVIGRSEAYYFSVVTLTTVGYGDLTPVHPIARSLAALEALIGQLYPAILIGSLVSQELAGRPARRS